jgi:hypothetical protein
MNRFSLSRNIAHLFSRLRKRFHREMNTRRWTKVLALEDVEAKFTTIYEKGLWLGSESSCGFGSGVAHTEVIRNELRNLILNYKIEKVFDVGCGDFNWMRLAITNLSIDYIGGDVLTNLMKINNAKYGNDHVSFIPFNVLTDHIPKSDLVICRDVLFHFSFSDIFRTLNAFSSSNSRYFLLTSHVNSDGFENQDIVTGDFRLLDLFSEPFNLPNENLLQIEDWIFPDPPRRMYLFTREQIRGY